MSRLRWPSSPLKIIPVRPPRRSSRAPTGSTRDHATLAQAREMSVADDQMVEHFDSDHTPGLRKPRRDPQIVRARLGRAGWVVVHENDSRGAEPNRGLEDLAWVDVGAVETADRDGGNLDDLMPRVQQYGTEVLAIEVAETWADDGSNVSRRAHH